MFWTTASQVHISISPIGRQRREPHVSTPPDAAVGVVPDSSGTAQNLEIPDMVAVRDSEQPCIFNFDGAALTTRLFEGYNCYSRSVTAFPPALSSLCIGRSNMDANNYSNGHIRKIIYWPTAFGNAEMEEIISNH